MGIEGVYTRSDCRYREVGGLNTKCNLWFFSGLATAGAFLFIQSIGVTLFGMIALFIVWYSTVGKLKIKSLLQPYYIFVLYWSPSIYMLTGTDNPTPLNTYIPCYNSKEQTMSVIHVLKANYTELVVMDDSLNFIKKRIGWLVHDPRVYSRNDPVIMYIKTHYRLEKVIPGYKIYSLKKR